MVMATLSAQPFTSPGDKYLIGPLQFQRDNAANDAALCRANVLALQEEIEALKKQIAELK
jgi:hypothetical protein